MAEEAAARAGARAPALQWLLPLLWAALIALAGHALPALTPAAVFAVTLALAAPALVCALYLLTARKIHRLAGVSTGGWLHRLLGGRVLGTLGWCALAPVLTGFALLQFHAYTAAEWIGYAAVAPLLLLTCLLLRRLAAGELRPYRHSAETLRLARLITPSLALLAYLLVLGLGGGAHEVGSLREAIDLRRGALATPLPSAVVEQALTVLAHYEGARLFVAGQLGAPGTLLPVLVLAAGTWLAYFGLTLMVAAFVVPAREYRRVFSRLSDADDPPRPEFGRVLGTAAIVVLVIGFVALPGYAALEARAAQARAEVQRALATAVVLIDGLPHSPAVLAQQRALQRDLIERLEAIEPTLQASAERGFVRMEANVEGFLDWYYGLTAEYLRTWSLLQGELEALVGERLREHLQRGDPFAEFEAALAAALREVDALRDAFAAQTAVVLAGGRIDAAAVGPLQVLSEHTLGELLLLPELDEHIPLAARVGSGGASGALTTLAAGRIVASVYASGTVKLAAQPLIKAALPRLAAAAAGAAAGAGVGSAVPGPGTLIGAAVGTVAGLVIGIGADYGLLKLEEQLGRDAFRAQLLAGIDATRAELLGR
jgi:hypothetical protein